MRHKRSVIVYIKGSKLIPQMQLNPPAALPAFPLYGARVIAHSVRSTPISTMIVILRMRIFKLSYILLLRSFARDFDTGFNFLCPIIFSQQWKKYLLYSSTLTVLNNAAFSSKTFFVLYVYVFPHT